MTDSMISAIASVKIAEKILGIDDSIEVVFKGNEYFKGEDVIGTFVKDGYYIVFNTEFFGKVVEAELMVTGFHKTRHAYQHMLIKYKNKFKFRYEESDETLTLWKEDFDNPILPSSVSDKEYIKRPIEIDAVAFSYYLVDELLKQKQVLPIEIKEEVLKRV